MNTELNDLWKKAKAQIEVKMGTTAEFKTFFGSTHLLQIKNKLATIGCPNAYVLDWLRNRHEKLISETLSFILDEKIDIFFEIINDPEIKLESLTEKAAPLLRIENGVMCSVMDTIQKSGLNIKHSLSNYIVGNSNRLAHAAAMAVIENPGTLYNPLFIHGKTGVGKTHLAQAIGRGLLERSLNTKVIYTTSENFLNEMVRSFKTGKQQKFRDKYRNVDLFIIDDMQLISKWVATQDEFFNAYNEMYNAGKQIIIIADRRPEEFKTIESRLKSRMQGGLIVDIQQADFEMRLAILNRKADEYGIDLPMHIQEYIARAINDNTRELEGALQKISLFNQMKTNGDMTLEEVAHTLGVDPKSKRDQIKVPTVLREVGKEFSVKIKDIKGPSRTKDVAMARQICMYILREEFNYKLEQIAVLLGRKDHTTVIHGIEKVKNKMMIQDEFNFQISKIIRTIADSSIIEDE